MAAGPVPHRNLRCCLSRRLTRKALRDRQTDNFALPADRSVSLLRLVCVHWPSLGACLCCAQTHRTDLGWRSARAGREAGRRRRHSCRPAAAAREPGSTVLVPSAHTAGTTDDIAHSSSRQGRSRTPDPWLDQEECIKHLIVPHPASCITSISSPLSAASTHTLTHTLTSSENQIRP